MSFPSLTENRQRQDTQVTTCSPKAPVQSNTQSTTVIPSSLAAISNTASIYSALRLTGMSRGEILVKLGNETYDKETASEIDLEIENLRLLAVEHLSSARKALCDLAGISSAHYPAQKIKILNLLTDLLENDPMTKETAHGVVELALNLMTKLNRDNISRQTIEVQAVTAKAYASALELMLRHFSWGHNNAITKEDQQELLKTKESLKALNAQKDPQVQFYADVAQEAIKRFKTDSSPYAIAFGGIATFLDTLGDFYQSKKIGGLLAGIYKAIQSIDNCIEKDWYNARIIINEITSNAKQDIQQVLALQVMLKSNDNWKVKAGIIERLTKIAKESPHQEIRLAALCGVTLKNEKASGLLEYTSFSGKDEKVQQYIRFYTTQLLAGLLKISKDPEVKELVNYQFIICSKTEKNEAIKKYLISNVNLSPLNKSEMPMHSSQNAQKTSSSIHQVTKEAANPKTTAKTILSVKDLPHKTNFSPPKQRTIKEQAQMKLDEESRLKHEMQYKTAEIQAKVKASTESPKSDGKYDGKYESKQDVKSPEKSTKPVNPPSLAFELLLPRLKGLKAGDLAGNTIQIVKGKLCFFEKDMRLLIDFLKRNPSITTLDLSGLLTDQIAGLSVLADALPDTSVTLVKLSCDISESEIEAFAKAIIATENAEEELQVDLLKSANQMNSLAKALGNQGYENLKVEYLMKGIELHPEDLEIYKLYYNCGLTHAKNDNYLKAIEFFNNSLKINPRHFSSMTSLADAYGETNKFDESIQWSQKAIETEPNNPSGPFTLGSCLWTKLGEEECQESAKWQEAIECYQKADEMIKIESKKISTTKKLLQDYQKLSIKIQGCISDLKENL